MNSRETPTLLDWLGAGEASVLDEADLADLEVAVEAVLAGGREVMRRYRARDPMEVDEKAPDDPVTEADRAADRAIVRVLEQRRPGEEILSEEGDDEPIAGGEPGASGRGHLWVVDPLDGTKEFLARNGEFAVMVGLAVEGAARLGVVYRPDPGVLYLGSTAGGAWAGRLKEGRKVAAGGSGDAGPDAGADSEAGDDEEDAEPEVHGLADFRDPMPLSVADGRAGPVRILHSRSHTPEGLERLAEVLGKVELVPLGSAGLKCSGVAAGAGDLYVHPVPYMKEWDTCAPEAVLRGAGGRVSDCRGRPLRYGKQNPAQEGGIFAGRPEAWEKARDVVAELAPEEEASA